ncbi:MAG: helix-turn-helix domain-containing protein, partial [Acidimicrobiia bacterium]
MASSPGSFGELIRERREAAGLSQAGLGELVGRSASAVRNWERGKSLPGEPEVMSGLATVLGISEVELSRVLEPDQLPFEPVFADEPESSAESPDWLETLLGPLERELPPPPAPVASLPETTEETVVERPAPAASPARPAQPEAPPGIPASPTSLKQAPSSRPPVRPAAPPAPASAPSYLEDPEQVAFYRYRALV